MASLIARMTAGTGNSCVRVPERRRALPPCGFSGVPTQTAPPSKCSFFQIGHVLLEPHDEVGSRGERGLSMGRRDGHDHRVLADLEPADAVGAGQRRDGVLRHELRADPPSRIAIGS